MLLARGVTTAKAGVLIDIEGDALAGAARPAFFDVKPMRSVLHRKGTAEYPVALSAKG